jgi:hypothetical protein
MTEPLHTIGGEPIEPGVDLAGLAMRTLALGAATGAGLEFLVLWGTRMLNVNAPPSDTPTVGTAFYLVMFGTAAAMALAATTVWSLLAPVGSAWRRAGLAAIAAFATLVAAALAVPIDATFGPTALLPGAAIWGLVAWRAGRLVAAWYRDTP